MDFLFNPELKSAIYMIPGIAAMVILFITVLMTALGVVRERERGTLEQLVVSPIRPLELMIGKMLPYSLVGLLDFTLVLLLAIYIFDVPFAGNLAVFYGITVFFLLSALGLGLVASSAAQNQQQAMQMAMFVVFPQMLLSGVIFPLQAMPMPIKVIAQAFPLTYYVPIARGMFVKGLSLASLQGQAIALVIYGLVMIVIASILFRRKLD
jgi:ABC-2 type transport system permease protein